ncbi:HEWD family protein [Halorientalis pallida]|uniref:HEWD domain-containing protein n=1 Tax=Halorientalis pallida TaxID=2479928 RepID=A0A498KV46_9EURY|nr:HEWD family protein [Halorientalis pallida]RXK49109.1 hypothetical protein EAF64_09270 [Halorientalis pallida]
MAEVIPPTERVCERCGRHDRWEEARDTWVIVTEDGEKAVGNPHCLHEWDINGDYNPFEG